MELIIYAVITTSMWICALTVGLPLTIAVALSRTCSEKFMEIIFTLLKPMMALLIKERREHCFKMLKQHLDTSAPLRLLEIGAGLGANFEYYPENSNLVAIDKNEHFEKHFHENHKKYPKVKLDKFIIGVAEDMKEVDDNSVDVVVSTYVLCSVSDVHQVLKEVNRVLKPGGRFTFLEHVAYPNSDWRFTLQQLTAPLWKLYFDGCCLDRDILFDIKKEFATVDGQTVENRLPMYFRRQIVGVATKKTH